MVALVPYVPPAAADADPEVKDDFHRLAADRAVANLNDISHCRAPRQHHEKRRPISSCGKRDRPGSAGDGETARASTGAFTCRVRPALSRPRVDGIKLPVLELLE